VIIIINHSVTTDKLGEVNGLGQSFAAAARSIGPAIGGAMWSISVRNRFIFMNFIVASSVLLATQYIAYLLPDSLDYQKKPSSPIKKSKTSSDESDSISSGMHA
jgi:hypothetical protein